MVEAGIVIGGDSAMQYLATDAELGRLGRSEHPILRAAAFREMLERKSFNHPAIIAQHLDDTALVFVDAGEFGIWNRTVSDDILQEARWKTQEAKNATVEQVLTKHNYLRSAYLILMRIKPQEKYYPFIKDMAARPQRLDKYDGYELGFGNVEYALFGLAGFRKKEDVELIRSKMMQHVWRLSDVSFHLMKKFPDTAYFDVLQAYHRWQFYSFSGNRPHGFSGVAADRAAPEDFIEALVAQQSDRSARLLDTMVNRLPALTSLPDNNSIFNALVMAIWHHPCPAYEKLRKKIEPTAKEISKGRFCLTLDSSSMAVTDTSEILFRW